MDGLGHFRAPGDNNTAEIYGGLPARKSFRANFFFWNISRPKREGLVDPQFRLLGSSKAQA
jgi:hypothetical protein